MKQINCPICNCKEFKHLFRAKDYSFKVSTEFILVECLECHLVYLNPQPESKELNNFYPVEFYNAPEDKLRLRMPGFMLFNRYKQIKRLKSKGTLLDIGCGAAVYLKKLQSEGWTVHGLDNSDFACQIAAVNIGKENVFHGDLNLPGFLDKSYDVITLWHVIEHLPDPKETLKSCRRLLKDDGVLIIACPDFGSLLRKTFGNSWYPLAIPVHLLHFKYPVLENLLVRAGFTVALRKKHFIDPFTNMGSFKISLMRFFGFGNLTTLASEPAEEIKIKKYKIIWKSARALFNAFCFAVSMLLSVAGNEETMLVWAKKDFKNND